MDVTHWKTPAAFFPWPHVQEYVDRIDPAVYRAAIELAQEEFLARASPCPQCGTPAAELFWFSVTDPEAAWDAGTGRVGFLTTCKRCQLQVDFLVDPELTEMQAEQWRACRTLA
jgi:hypothetical protein